MNFRYKLMQFFRGRYGIDQLFWGLFVLAAAIAFINLFLRSRILQFLVYAIELVALFRALSKDHYKRRNENQKYMAFLNKFKGKAENMKQRNSDKSHIYRKCPACKATLRLPRKKGKHTVNCPKCTHTFKTRVF